MVSTSANIELSLDEAQVQGCKELNSKPEDFSGSVDEFGNVLLSWRKIHSSLSFQLQSYNAETRIWNTIYSGSNSTYLATNLNVGRQNFRVRACEDKSCGAYAILAFNVNEIQQTQCIPFVIDPEYQ